MSSKNTPLKTKKYLAWTVFWLSPVAIIIVLSQLFAGTPAQADDSIQWAGSDSAPRLNNRPAAAVATPAAPAPFEQHAASTNPGPTGTPTPAGSLLETNAETPSQWFVYLPVLFKGEIFPAPYHSLAQLFGPVLDPGVAVSALGSQDEVTIQFGPTLDPPPPATPTSDVPTVIPGSPTYTPTPKITLTPTPTPTATPALIPGGDFDSENARIRWREFSLIGYPLFFDDKDSSPPSIYGGAFSPDWAVWLGGDDNEISYIEGQVTVPTSRNYIGHVIKLQSYDTLCASSLYNDVTLAGHLRYASPSTLNAFGVDIGGMLICENFSGRAGCGSSDAIRVLVTGYSLCNVPDATGWGIFVVPLAGSGYDFRGKTVTIQIKVITDGQLSSSVFVDDVVWLDGLPTGSITGLSIQTAGPQTLEPVLLSDPALFEAAGLPIPPEKITLSTADTGSTFSKSR